MILNNGTTKSELQSDHASHTNVNPLWYKAFQKEMSKTKIWSEVTTKKSGINDFGKSWKTSASQM